MADHAKVRTLEDLRAHFDLKSIIGYVLDGKLQKWLEYRYYENEAKALKNLNTKNLDVEALCTLLGVNCPENISYSLIDVNTIQSIGEKLDRLKQLTDDVTLWKKVELIAFSQDDLEKLLKKGEKTIYLCGENFFVSAHWPGVSYIGILSVPWIESNIATVEELKEKQITFSNVNLPKNLKATEYRLFEESHRYIPFPYPWKKYALDKKILANQDVYPKMDWYDFAYGLFHNGFNSFYKIPIKWETFIKSDEWDWEEDGHLSWGSVGKEEFLRAQYNAQHTSQFSYYDVICELLRYFLQKDMESINSLGISSEYRTMKINDNETRVITIYGCICDRLAGKCHTWTVSGGWDRISLRKAEKEIAQIIYTQLTKNL